MNNCKVALNKFFARQIDTETETELEIEIYLHFIPEYIWFSLVNK